MKKLRTKSEILFRFLVYILPGVLFFSYYPLIHFGSDGSMNFEVSLVLIWLVLFDFLAFLILARRRLFSRVWRWWPWLLLPIFLTISVLWSLNSLRGLLTVGILWLLYFAIYGFFCLKDLFNDAKFKENFWKCFFWSSLVICFWCFLQCVLDLAGVSKDYSLICAGCGYMMFGFPHPNGLAIEPQFMGNLLLAPAIVAGWFCIDRGCREKYFGNSISFRFLLISVFVFTATLFLTFSRGAIYAFVVAMIFMTFFSIMREKEARKNLVKRFVGVWILIVGAFLFTLNLQGVMAQVSKTDDTYVSGVSKVINHLSLGLINLSGNSNTEKGEENFVISDSQNDREEAVFDGYVAESTDTRVKLSNAAIAIWSKDLRTIMFGVGIGGAGRALYINGLSSTSKEIVQNQYASLLLETGVVGVGLLIFTLTLVLRAIMKKGTVRVMILALIIAYGVSLFFFAGLPNALHIYLLPAIIMAVYSESNSRRKKLVS